MTSREPLAVHAEDELAERLELQHQLVEQRGRNAESTTSVSAMPVAE